MEAELEWRLHPLTTYCGRDAQRFDEHVRLLARACERIRVRRPGDAEAQTVATLAYVLTMPMFRDLHAEVTRSVVGDVDVERLFEHMCQAATLLHRRPRAIDPWCTAAVLAKRGHAHTHDDECGELARDDDWTAWWCEP